MSRGIMIGVVIIILIIIGFSIFNLQGDGKRQVSDNRNTESISIPALEAGSEGVEEMIVEGDVMDDVIDNVAESHDVEIRDSGFVPNTLEINKGDRVVFINKGDKLHWPASDVHPSHRAYPGSDINKCKSQSERQNTFDACHRLTQGERYSFEFNEIGRWRYHDHLNPGLEGLIIVN